MMADPILLRILRRSGFELHRRADSASVSRALRVAGVPQAHSIPTYTRPSELKALYDLARSLPKGAAALEIGSYLGASACYLAAGLSHVGGKLYCVDTWQNQTMPDGERDTLCEFENNTRPIRSHIHIIRKRTDQLTRQDVPPDLELIFIDGDHSYDAVKSDFYHVSPWLSRTGVVAFHDAYYWKDVARLIGQAVATGDWVFDGRIDDLVWLRRSNFLH
jgi:predicted O-methyltransferase YrrM